MFKQGEKVVCIKGATAIDGKILKEGKEYVVLGITKCKCEQIIYVGIATNRGTTCQKCGVTVSNSNWWHYSHRFVRAEEWSEAEQAVEKLLKPDVVLI